MDCSCSYMNNTKQGYSDMNNMSSLGEKIRKIREAEGINRRDLSNMLNIPYSSLNNYEAGRIQVTENIMVRITNHPLFKKYTLWLMTGEVAPLAGQIEPAFSLSGSEVSEKKDQRKSFHTKVNGC